MDVGRLGQSIGEFSGREGQDTGLFYHHLSFNGTRGYQGNGAGVTWPAGPEQDWFGFASVIWELCNHVRRMLPPRAVATNQVGPIETGYGRRHCITDRVPQPLC